MALQVLKYPIPLNHFGEQEIEFSITGRIQKILSCVTKINGESFLYAETWDHLSEVTVDFLLISTGHRYNTWDPCSEFKFLATISLNGGQGVYHLFQR